MLSRSNTNLYLSSLTAGLTAALFGYSIGFIGGLLILPSFLSNYHLLSLSPSSLASVRSTIVSSWLFGALLGVPIAIPICSKLGRKHCLFFSASLYILGTVLQLVDFSGSGENAIWMFDTGRLINGIGVGAGTLVGPMYISEISPKEMRGLLMSGYQTILQLSALAGFWITYFCHSLISDNNHLQFQLPIAIQLALGTFMMLGTCGVVESPRFLAEKGGEGVEESLAWLRGMGDKQLNTGLVEEVEEIIEAARISRVTGGKGESFAKEVMKRGTRRRLAVGVGLMIAQNMVGLNALNYYAPVIFISAGFTTLSSSLFLTGVFGVVKLVSAIMFMFMFVRIKGNRFWLKIGSTICGVSMLVLAYFVHALPPPDKLAESNITLSGVTSVLMVYIFAFSFGVSLGPISWNVCSEIFPLHINAKCCAITTCMQWLFQIVIASITPRLIASVGWVTYLLYAMFCTITLFWVIFCVPETRDVALGKAMDEVFGDITEGDEENLEVTETTRLLKIDGMRRRGSLGAYT